MKPLLLKPTETEAPTFFPDSPWVLEWEEQFAAAGFPLQPPGRQLFPTSALPPLKAALLVVSPSSGLLLPTPASGGAGPGASLLADSDLCHCPEM